MRCEKRKADSDWMESIWPLSVRPRDPPPLARRASARSESAEAHGAKAESGDPGVTLQRLRLLLWVPAFAGTNGG
jgi:hypothetical protein